MAPAAAAAAATVGDTATAAAAIVGDTATAIYDACKTPLAPYHIEAQGGGRVY